MIKRSLVLTFTTFAVIGCTPDQVNQAKAILAASNGAPSDASAKPSPSPVAVTSPQPTATPTPPQEVAVKVRVAYIKPTGEVLPVPQHAISLNPYSQKELKTRLIAKNNPGPKPIMPRPSILIPGTSYNSYPEILEWYSSTAIPWMQRAYVGADNEAKVMAGGISSVAGKTSLDGIATFKVKPGKWWISSAWNTDGPIDSPGSWSGTLYIWDYAIDVSQENKDFEVSTRDAVIGNAVVKDYGFEVAPLKF